MANHELKDIADGVLAALTADLTPTYPGISLTKGLFRTNWLPAFDQWAVRVAPGGTPWTEREIGVRTFQRIYQFDLFLLCKATDEADLALWGEASDALKGIFQLVEDVKVTLRGNSLSSLLDRSFVEVVGPVTFDQTAVPGFETAGRVLVHRARVPYQPRTRPFCVPL